MAITQATQLADFTSGIGTAGAILEVDNVNNKIGIGTTNPQALLQVGQIIKMDGPSGIVTATTFSGNFTGNITGTATGLSGTPNITVNNIVAAAATFSGEVTYEDVTNIDSIGVITARDNVVIADKIIHLSDTNTAIRFPSADTFTVETSGVQRLEVDSTGDLGLVGIATATGLVVVAGSGGYAGHTGIITAVTFDGNVTGNLTGNVTGAVDLNGGVLTLDADADTTITADTDDQIDIAFGGNDRITLSTGLIDLKNDGSQSALRLYCESSNAHYAALQAPAHSAFSGNITLTLPATTDTLIGRTTTDTLTNKTLTSPTITGTGNIAGTFTGNVTGNADTATTLATARNIGGVSFDGSAAINLPGVNATGNQDTSGTASIATNVTVADESSDTTCFPLFATAATGNLPPKSGTNLTFNSSTGALTATSFVGALTGAVTGNADTATNASGLTGTPNISCGTGAFSGVVTLQNNLDLQDDDKILLGTGDDLEIYHDGSNSIINDGGTGNLQLQAAGTTRIEVTTSGATVTGTLNATTALTQDGKGLATTGKAIAMAMVFG